MGIFSKKGGGGGGINANLPKQHDKYGTMNFSTGGGGGYMNNIERKINPYNTEKSREISKEGDRLAEEQFAAGQAVSGKMSAADKAYGDAFSAGSSKYKQARDDAIGIWSQQNTKLQTEAEQQGKDARLTYSNDIQPRMKANMEAAMTLKDAGDPNNSIQKAVREMYGKQGQKARQQGQQDFGVLSALGAQSAQGQFGAGGPMTAGAMGQIYGQNQQQAGNAYAKAQERMYDLEQQGIDRGFDESANQYERGQGATRDYFDAEGAQQQRNAANRDERGGYSGDRFGMYGQRAAEDFNIGKEYAGIGQAAAYGAGDRELAGLGQRYGYKQQGITNRLEAEEAARQGKISSVNQSMETAGDIAGGAGGMMSDKRSKKNISAVSDHELDEFLAAVKPKSYDYKDPGKSGTEGGRRVGFMLQDVQGTELGDAMTRRDNKGRLYLDKDNLDGIILAGLSKQARERKRA